MAVHVVKITKWQAVWLITGTILPTAILTSPAVTIRHASIDAWISVLLSAFGGIAAAWLAVRIAMSHPGLDIFQIAEREWGRWFSKGLGLFFAFYYFLGSADILYQFAIFMVQSVMKRTPMLVFVMIATVLALYAVHYGMETIARVNAMIMVGSILIFSFSTLFYLRQMDFSRLLPVTGASWASILRGAYYPLDWFSEVSIIMLLAPFLHHPRKAAAAANIGIVLSGVGLSWAIAGSIAVFGAPLLTYYEYPTFSVFRIIEVNHFVERTEALYIAVWVGMMIMKLAIFMFACIYCLCGTFAVQKTSPFLLPLGLLTAFVSMSFWRTPAEYKSMIPAINGFILTVNLAVPLCLVASLYVKKLWEKVRH